MGDCENNTLVYYQPKKGEFDEKMMSSSTSYQNMNWVMKHYEKTKCRVNAENPLTLLPSTGSVKTYHPPGGPGVRIDSALYSGCNISSFYDGLISKLICTGNNRHECIMRLRRALDEYVIEGVQTNIPVLKKIIKSKDFIDGKFDINWMSTL